jgi:DhnA family fructose-bisphosphate aldolase class Ia
MICRLNWNSIHCEPWQYHEAQIVPAMSVEGAMRVGAEVVMAGLVLKTGSEARDAANVALFSRLAEDAARLGIPLIGEVFPLPELRQQPAEFHDYVVKTCRIACELGADAIKTFYTGPQFAEVTAGTPVPIFALGAEKYADEVDALQLARHAVQAGARGVVFGRNVLQARDPARFLRALKSTVQGAGDPAHVAQMQLA